MRIKISRRTRGRRAAGKRGMAMVGVMLVLMGLLSLTLLGMISGSRSGGSGTMAVTGNGLQSAVHQTQNTAAFNLAESGVEYTLIWMHSLPVPPALGRSFPLPAWNGQPGDAAVTYSVGGGTFKVTVFPDASNNVVSATDGNVGSTPKRYLIQSTGTYGGVSQTVLSYIQQVSFGKYAHFNDVDLANLYMVGGISAYDGPVHSNNSDGVPAQIVWVDNKPIFKYAGSDAFTYSGSVSWHHNTTGDNTAPQSTTDWNSVASYGQAGVNKTPAIVLPIAGLKQQYAALGLTMPDGTTGAPAGAPGAGTPSGVSIIPGGGIYIHCVNSADANDAPPNGSPVNDVQQMVMSTDGSGNQVITIQQKNDAGVLTQTQITLDKAASPKKTHLSSGPVNADGVTFAMTAQPDVSGVTNGVVYCDGNIGATGSNAYCTGDPSGAGFKGKGLSGTIADGQGLTVATDANKNINLNGSLAYKTKRAADAAGNPLPLTDTRNAAFVQNAGTLGLVSNTVQFVDNDANGARLGDLEMDATLLAGNTMKTVDNGTYYIDQNSSNAMGSGSFNGQTYYGHWLRPSHKLLCIGGVIEKTAGGIGQFNGSNGQQISGFAPIYSYDARLANSPPPFFPTTNNQYDILSWQTVARPIQ